MQADLGKNYFELFGLPVSFDLDPADLAARYRKLQHRFHPDRFASRPDQERRLSLQLAAHINEAFQTLKEPLTRARYLLRLRGVDTDEDTDTVMDPAFLTEQMEFREGLAEARTAADRDLRFARLAHDVRERLSARSEELRRCLSQDSAPTRQRARALVREMQFLTKLRKEIEGLEHPD